MAQLKIDRIRKSFGKTDVLKGVDLDIADGEFIVLLGASGCHRVVRHDTRQISGLTDKNGNDRRADSHSPS